MQTIFYKKLMLNIQKLINRIKDYYSDNLESIILFGSAVRGDLTLNSDIDLLIILHRSPDGVRERFRDFYRHVGDYLEEDFDLALSPLILTIDEMKNFHPFYLGVFENFNILYDKNNFAQDIFFAIQRLKDEKKIEEYELDGRRYWRVKV